MKTLNHMSCMCSIIPESVLLRLSHDPELSVELRQQFQASVEIDRHVRAIRAEATLVTTLMATNAAIAGVAPATLAAAPLVTVYDCNHSTTPPGVPVANPGASSDLSAKRAFDETTDVAKFFKTVFGRNSVDNAGMTLLSSIHYGVRYNNAFWNGSQMTYGDGDGSVFVDFTQGNDVIAHELTHGVTQHTLGLNYVNEAGGLNESISDVFGSMFRQWQAKQSVSKADWLIGHDILGPVAKARGFTCLRDMANPGASHCLSPQPTHFSQYHGGMDPHLSSGIPNLAFNKSALAVGGNSWDKVGQIWYQVLAKNSPHPKMLMSEFANATRAMANKLYPGTAVHGAVDSGWKSVGL
jgi:Zn-dependent metalloprotease